MKVTKEKHCRICSGDLVEFLNLGDIYPSAFVRSNTPCEAAPLTLSVCSVCGLVQLLHTVDLDSMYRDYYYQSGINSSMKDSLRNIVADIILTTELKDDDIVVDIGCNDGTMLNMFPSRVIKVGFDPANNLKEKADKVCDVFINDYFSLAGYSEFIAKPAKVVTSIAMFYDLQNPNKFVHDVKSILAKDGIWIIQLTDFTSMLKINAFDNICHEHLEYYTLNYLVDYLATFGLSVFKVSYNDVNGGSLRIFVSYPTMYRIEKNVFDFLKEEIDYLSNNPVIRFIEKLETFKEATVKELETMRRKGKLVYGLGASTKGNTLLQYYEINTHLVSKIADVNVDKFGKFTVGTLIPIIPENIALSEEPDVFFVLPWHFIDNFINILDEYLNTGGELFVPLPEPKIYYKEDGIIQSRLI